MLAHILFCPVYISIIQANKTVSVLATMYEPIQQAISLRNFTRAYGSKLPQVIVASESVYGVHDNILQSGQQFEAYFMKEMPVITMKVAERRYTVPVNSSYKFGVLYNPRNDDLSTARIGRQFEKAADLMKAVPLPSVVYVGKECTGLGERGEESIKVGTLLLVKGIERHHHSGKANMLKCLKATYNNEAELEEVYFSGKRKGYFSTQESLVCFPLSVLLKHFEVPINVSIYHGDVNALHKKFNDKSAVIESKEISTLTSVIVSLHSTSQCPPSKLLEMHSEISMDFYVSCIEGKEMDELKQKAISLSHSLSPEQAKVIFTLGFENPLQRDLFSPVNNKEWLHEVHSFNDTVYETMVTPPAATKPVASPLVPFAILPQPIVELPSTMGAMKSKGRASKRQPSLDCSHSPQESTIAVQGI